jgi:hypothetical protein
MISKAREASPSKGFKFGQRRKEIGVGGVGAPPPVESGRIWGEKKRRVNEKSPRGPFIPRSFSPVVLPVRKDRYYRLVRSVQIDGA